MAILLEPLFGDQARGQIAKAAIFKRSAVHPQFGGRFYHKQNWTSPHIARAKAWQSLCLTWHALSDTLRQNWADIAPGVLTGFNYFIQQAGVYPGPPPYQVPPGDNIQFNFTKTPYTIPPGGTVNFNIGWWPA